MRKGGVGIASRCLDILLEVVPEDPEAISRYISEALEGISEALEHIQGVFRGYVGARVFLMASC